MQKGDRKIFNKSNQIDLSMLRVLTKIPWNLKKRIELSPSSESLFASDMFIHLAKEHQSINLPIAQCVVHCSCTSNKRTRGAYHVGCMTSVNIVFFLQYFLAYFCFPLFFLMFLDFQICSVMLSYSMPYYRHITRFIFNTF